MACRSLQSIQLINSCESNRGGLYTTVYLGERKDITITKATNNQSEETGYVTIAKATGVTNSPLKAFQFRKQSSNLTSEYTADDTIGTYFVTSTLSLVFAKQDVAKRLAIQSVVLNPDLFAIVKDSNGKIYFLGADESVTATGAGAQTGTAFTDANQYTLTLTDMSNELPYFVTDANLDTLLA